MSAKPLPTEEVQLSQLRPHPRNYREHPQDQLLQLAASIEQHGLYRNLVVARDGTILAGHGVAKALALLERKTARVVRLDIDPDSPQALKVLAGDNETARLAEVDDRALSELLKEVKTLDEFGLDGSGFDEMMLANLVMVTRPASEIADQSEAAEWIGMPSYVPKDNGYKYIIQFATPELRQQFSEQSGLKIGTAEKRAWSAHWPAKEREDPQSVRFEE